MPFILQQVAEPEVKAGRPMLSAVVVSKTSFAPAPGLFSLAKILGLTVVDEDAFWAQQWRKCVIYWRKHA
jgi:hypothetical protein